MNNDMINKSNMHIATNRLNSVDGNIAQKKTFEKTTFSNGDLQKDTFVSTNNDAQNVSIRVDKSVQSFLNDSQNAQSYVEFCDELVKKGYNLREAIDTTDKIFELLKEEELYK